VGHLILCQSHPAQAGEAFASMHMPWGAALAERERAVWGVDHAQVSALWVRKLNMPDAVAEAIAHSLDPLDAGGPLLGRVVKMACGVAGAITGGDSAERAARSIDAALVTLLALDDYVGGDAFADDYADLRALPALA
jgi:HD-like signal output (HDOD) protein